MKLLTSLMNEMNNYQKHVNLVMYLVCDYLYRQSISRNGRIFQMSHTPKKYETIVVKFCTQMEKDIAGHCPFLCQIISRNIQVAIDTLLHEGVLTKVSCYLFSLNVGDGIYGQASRHNLATFAYDVFRIAENYVILLH